MENWETGFRKLVQGLIYLHSQPVAFQYIDVSVKGIGVGLLPLNPYFKGPAA